MEIYEKLRLQNVNRWTLIATSRPQSVAEHSYNVAMMVRWACEQLPTYKIHCGYIAMAALDHDLDEAIFGDVPTPTKSAMRQKGFDFSELESPTDEVLRMNDYEKSVIKACDILESIHFLDNFGIGKRADDVKEELEGNLIEFLSNKPPELRDVILDLQLELTNG